MIQNNITPIVIVLAAALAVMVALVIFLFWRIRRFEGDYELLTRGTEGRNFVEIVSDNITQTERLVEEVDMLSERYAFVLRRIAGAVQHVGVVRYDAFRDLGGLLSFSVALLDDRGNGLIMSSIYGRSESRTYSKPIVERGSSYELSPEEREAIRLAMQSKELGALPVEARNQEHEEKIANLRLFHDKEIMEQTRVESEARPARRPERVAPGPVERPQRKPRNAERPQPRSPGADEPPLEDPGNAGEEPRARQIRTTVGTARRAARPPDPEDATRAPARKTRRGKPPAEKSFDRRSEITARRASAGTGKPAIEDEPSVEAEATASNDGKASERAQVRKPSKRSRSLNTPVERLRDREPGER